MMTIGTTAREIAEHFVGEPSNIDDLERAILRHMEHHTEALRLEVEVLRMYGNKDCTAMADEALEQKRNTGKGPWED